MPLSRLAVLKNKRSQEFIAFALKEGWQVKLTPKGNIQLKRKGYATIYNATYLIVNRHYTMEQLIQENSQSKKTKGRRI